MVSRKGRWCHCGATVVPLWCHPGSGIKAAPQAPSICIAPSLIKTLETVTWTTCTSPLLCLIHTLHHNGYNICSCNFQLSYVFYATQYASVKPYFGSPVYYLNSAPTWLSSIPSPRQQYSIATCYCRAFFWPSLTEFVNARFLRNRSPLLYSRLVPSRVRDSSQDESSFNKVTKGRF